MGTCGFAEAQQRLFHDFTILEVQQTFYQLPRVSTAQRCRSTAPKDFIFALKAWQLITHKATSPIYRRLNEPLSEQALARCGDFKWDNVTQMAWERTIAIADALNATVIVFQTPKRFLQRHFSSAFLIKRQLCKVGSFLLPHRQANVKKILHEKEWQKSPGS
ncbi:MAG: DUF72 domain-containing protein [Gammaproteobacteria bacterium]